MTEQNGGSDMHEAGETNIENRSLAIREKWEQCAAIVSLRVYNRDLGSHYPSLSCIGYRLERLSGRAVELTSVRALW